MFRAPSSAAMLLVCALGLLALVCAGHTAPPDTGDWVVGDSTHLTDANVTINGSVLVLPGGELVLVDSDLECRNISVLGGRLELLRTNVILAGSGPSTLNATSGQFTIDGCRIESDGQEATVRLGSGCLLNGTVISGSTSVMVAGWNAGVRNCTISNSLGSGITVAPLNMPQGSIDIIDNRILGAGETGIDVNLLGYSGETVFFNLMGNVIEEPGASGINLITGYLDGLQLILARNTVSGGIYHGIFAKIRGYAIVADLSGFHSQDAGMDGVRVVLDAVSVASLGLDDITVVNNTGFGLSIFSLYRRTSGIRIHRLNASGNGDGGLQLSLCSNVELWNSMVLNPGFNLGDYVVENSDLVIRSTAHRRAMVLLAGASSSVISLRRLELSAIWQDGSPVAYRQLHLVDEGSNVILSQVTDGSGRLGVNYVWDWKVTSQGTETRRSFQLVLAGEGWSLGSEALDLDRDRSSVLVLVDDIPPVLSVDHPICGTAQSATTMTVVGTCEDPQTGVALVQVSIDDEPDWSAKVWKDAIGTGSWRFSFDGLPDGVYNVHVRAFDVMNLPAGTYSRATVSDVVIDTVPPWLEVVAPSDGELTNSSTLMVRGRVEEGASVMVNGTAAQVSGDAFSARVLLLEGPNPLSVMAKDRAGNTKEVQITVELDTVAPFLVVDDVIDGRLPMPLEGRELSGRTEPVARLTLSLDGSKEVVDLNVDGSFSLWVPPLEDGAPVAIEAVDPAGNVALVELMVDLGDDIPPVIVVDGPKSNTSINTSSVTVSGRCHDPQGVALVQVSVDEVPDWSAKVWRDAVGTTSWSCTLSGLADGTYSIYVRAFDVLDLVDGTYSRAVVSHVTVDTIAPWLTVFDPLEGELTNQVRLEVRGTVEMGATVAVGSSAVGFTDVGFVAIVSLVEGINEVTILAVDEAGNVNVIVRRVVLDTVPPLIVVDDVEDGRLRMPKEGRAVTGWTEPGARLSILIKGTTVEVTPKGDGNFTQWLSGIRNGAKVSIEAVDPAGNVATVELDVELAVEGPSSPSGPSPVVLGVGALVVLAVLGAIASVETLRYALLVALVPLYARLKRKEVLDNNARYLLHGIIIDNPGIHYRALLREFGMSNGIAAYHLDVLEREGFIRSIRDGRLRRFYSVNVKVPQERRLPPEQLSARISRLVEEKPGISQKQIIEEMGLPRRVVGYHLKELVSRGELKASRQGRNTIYRMNPKRGGGSRSRALQRARSGDHRSEARAKTVDK